MFKKRIDEVQPHIILITETKLNPNDQVSEYFKIAKYNYIRKDRVARGGGGVIIFTKEGLNCEEIKLVSLNDIEMIVFKVIFQQKTLVCACIYRPPEPGDYYNQKVLQAIKEISDINADQFLICGDFNYSKIDWNNHDIPTAARDERDFYDSVQSAFLHQHVTEFTRQRGSDAPSLLDLVMSKNELEIDYIDYQSPLGKSNHAVLVFDFSLEGAIENEDEETNPKINFFKGNYSKMCELFQGTLHYSHFFRGVQTKWDRLISVFMYGKELFIPYGSSKSDGAPRNKWMTREVLRLIEIKENKWRAYRYNKTPTNQRIYNDARNASVDAVRNAKFRFEKSLAFEIGNGNPRAFYAYARSQTTIKESVSRVTGTDGSLTTNKKETADVMNLTFQSVFIHELDTHIPQPTHVFQGATLEDVFFTKETVHKIIVNLKESSAPGPDNLHPKVLIECADTLAQPLFEIFRESLDEGVKRVGFWTRDPNP